jgi:hypothetical protein
LAGTETKGRAKERQNEKKRGTDGGTDIRETDKGEAETSVTDVGREF